MNIKRSNLVFCRKPTTGTINPKQEQFMFCPRCGSTQNEDLNFCKLCGANLQAVRKAVDTRDTGKKFNWSNPWVAEMFMSGEEAVKRQQEMERQMGITPEVKRYNEIKAGVIVSSVGIAVAIFLHVFMKGIILGGSIPENEAEILSRVWIAGVIPIFVGLGLIINGVFVSKKQAEIAKRNREQALQGPDQMSPRSLRAANTSEFIPPDFSVTDQTTKHLRNTGQKQ
jgi:hypothetical protein